MALVSDLRSFLKRHIPSGRNTDQWPFLGGRYRVFDATAPVVVVGTSLETLAEDLAALATPGICMIATHCRTAGDVEKLIRNLAANMAIHNVIVAGSEADKTAALAALLTLLGAEVETTDEAQQIARKLTSKLDDVDLAALNRQIRAVSMLGVSETDRIVARISELASDANRPNTGFRAPAKEDENGIERVIAARNIDYEIQPDKAGSFFVSIKNGKIVVEQYSARNELLRIIEGHTARDLCITLIRNGWVSRLDHAAWLGRELLRAELSMQSGEQFVPDRTMALKIDPDDLTRH